jgi:hypothetical protein
LRAFRDHGRQRRDARRPIHLAAEVGQRREIMSEHLDVLPLEQAHFAPCSVRQRLKQHNDIVIRFGSGLAATARACQKSGHGRRMMLRHESADQIERAG